MVDVGNDGAIPPIYHADLSGASIPKMEVISMRVETDRLTGVPHSTSKRSTAVVTKKSISKEKECKML